MNWIYAMSNKKPNIKCKWMEEKRILVNPDGQVFPCCYLANVYYMSKQFFDQDREAQLYDGHKAEMKQMLLKKYAENEKENNIFETDMDTILNGEWLTKTLPESWESEDTVHIQCKRVCSVEDE